MTLPKTSFLAVAVATFGLVIGAAPVAAFDGGDPLTGQEKPRQEVAVDPSLTRAQEIADKRLSAIHADIASDYPGVNHLDTERFSAMDHDNAIVFDVRKPSEYAVSHLPGAINISPDMTAEAFIAAHGAQLGDRAVVFYCSVGRRSSIMAARVADQLGDTNQSYNLVGGIFRWRNEERPLAVSRPDGSVLPTDNVHPYNAFWGRYVADRKAIRYTPAPAEHTSTVPSNR